MDKKKILLFGGTFNPIHNGHLIVASSIAESMDFDKISFVPNGSPPHKEGVISKHHRFEMLKLALFSGYPNDNLFDICIYEIANDAKSYTLDTVRYFKRTLGDTIDKPYWLIGPDNLFDIDNWHESEPLAKECSFVVGISGKTDPVQYARSKEIDKIMMKYDIQTVSIPHIEIRSTEIRERVSKGLSIRHYVPDAVEEYIIKNELYRTH